MWFEGRQLKIGNNGPMIKGEQFSNKPLRFLLPWRTEQKKKKKQTKYVSKRKTTTTNSGMSCVRSFDKNAWEEIGMEISYHLSYTQAVPPPGNIATGCHPCYMCVGGGDRWRILKSAAGCVHGSPPSKVSSCQRFSKTTTTEACCWVLLLFLLF